jgi:DNA polymerase I
VSNNFAIIDVVDFEYEIEAGGLPRVLCMVVYVLNETLRHVRTIRMWRGEFGSTPPFDVGPDALFVAYSGWAELTCFMVLNWLFPTHVFDLHTAYLAASNILLPHDPDEVRKRPRKGLSDACRAHGIEGWENIDKPAVAKAIAQGRWSEFGKEAVLDYCEEDVKNSVKLLRAQLRGHCDQSGRTLLPAADVPRVLHWSNYSAKTVARIQARGIPIDIPLWNLVQENKRSVIHELLRQFDPSCNSEEPIFSPDGEWSYARFEHWLVHSGVPYWPRLESGKLDIDSDAFGLMSHIPGVAGIHTAR